jgi:hypothetical protein
MLGQRTGDYDVHIELGINVAHEEASFLTFLFKPTVYINDNSVLVCMHMTPRVASCATSSNVF